MLQLNKSELDTTYVHCIRNSQNIVMFPNIFLLPLLSAFRKQFTLRKDKLSVFYSLSINISILTFNKILRRWLFRLSSCFPMYLYGGHTIVICEEQKESTGRLSNLSLYQLYCVVQVAASRKAIIIQYISLYLNYFLYLHFNAEL